MAKKIIILNGSPRKNGNTSALTALFKKGAEEAGNTVTIRSSATTIPTRTKAPSSLSTRRP